MESYDAPYMAPYAPSVDIDKKDGFTKKPLSHMVYRPKSFVLKENIRQRNNKIKNIIKQGED